MIIKPSTRISQIMGLFRAKTDCRLCQLAFAFGGIRNGGRIYADMNRYLLIDNLNKWEDTEIAVMGVLKRHTSKPTPFERKTIEDALHELARERFKLKPGQYSVIETMKTFSCHYHQHLCVPKKDYKK